jgi:MFS family permease
VADPEGEPQAEPSPADAMVPGAGGEAASPGRVGGLGRDYWKLWSASVISNLGDGTSVIAYPWLASLLTRNPGLIAGLGVAQRLPWLLFTLPAGAITDRSDRRTLMVSMNAIRCVVSLVVALGVVQGWMSIPLLYLAVLVLGFAEVLYDNSAQTILPSVVPKERLERANGNLWGAELVTNQFLGPPLGGFLIAVAVSLPFFLDGATFALSAVLIIAISGSFRARATDGGEAEVADRPSMRREIADGVRWLWRHRLLRALAVILGLMNGLTALAAATYVLFVQEILGLSAAAFGVLMTAAAIGGVVGSQVAPMVSRRLGPGPSLYLTIAAGVVTCGVTGITSSPVVVGVMSATFMFSAVLWNVITVSLRQTIIPDELLGRVNSVYRFFGWGMMPVGALLGGLLVTAMEPAAGREWALRSPWLVAGAVYALVLVGAGRRLSTQAIEAAKAAAG